MKCPNPEDYDLDGNSLARCASLQKSITKWFNVVVGAMSLIVALFSYANGGYLINSFAVAITMFGLPAGIVYYFFITTFMKCPVEYRNYKKYRLEVDKYNHFVKNKKT